MATKGVFIAMAADQPVETTTNLFDHIAFKASSTRDMQGPQDRLGS